MPAAPRAPGGVLARGVDDCYATRVPAKPYILVVDDDPHIASLVSDHLESHGFKVTYCTDAAQCVVQSEGLPVKLFILDVVMTGFGSGVDAYKSIRENPRTREIPVIFLTGLKPEQARKLVPLGDPRVRLLHKPTPLMTLLNTINELTKQAPPQRG
jgi:CheY-like chemotaxis protein